MSNSTSIMMAKYGSALQTWNGGVLALDEQGVRWYWCMFEFEGGAAALVFDGVVGDSCDVQLRCNNGDGTRMALNWFWLDVWNGTVSCWLWTYRKYVGIYWYIFKFKVVINCLVYETFWDTWQLHARIHHFQIHYNGDGTRPRVHCDLNLTYGTVRLSCWLWTSRKYVDIGAFLIWRC